MIAQSPGVYQIVGKEFEVLALIIGTKPMLRIVCGILMNDFVLNKVTPLDQNSVEICLIEKNPQDFIFIPMQLSEVCNMPGIDSITSSNVEFSDDKFREWVNKYSQYKSLPNGTPLMVASLVEEKYSVPQALMIINLINRRIL